MCGRFCPLRRTSRNWHRVNYDIPIIQKPMHKAFEELQHTLALKSGHVWWTIRQQTWPALQLPFKKHRVKVQKTNLPYLYPCLLALWLWWTNPSWWWCFVCVFMFCNSALQSIFFSAFSVFLQRLWKFSAQAVFLPFQQCCLVIPLPET